MLDEPLKCFCFKPNCFDCQIVLWGLKRRRCIDRGSDCCNWQKEADFLLTRFQGFSSHLLVPRHKIYNDVYDVP